PVVPLRGRAENRLPADAGVALQLHRDRFGFGQRRQVEMHAAPLELDLRLARRTGAELQLNRAPRPAVRLTVAALVRELRGRLAPAGAPVADAPGRRAGARDRVAGGVVDAELIRARGERGAELGLRGGRAGAPLPREAVRRIERHVLHLEQRGGG